MGKMAVLRAFSIVLAFSMLVGANTAWAEDPEPHVVCCADGAACNPGQACCQKKAPAVACSDTEIKRCVDVASDCVSEEEN